MSTAHIAHRHICGQNTHIHAIKNESLKRVLPPSAYHFKLFCFINKFKRWNSCMKNARIVSHNRKKSLRRNEGRRKWRRRSMSEQEEWLSFLQDLLQPPFPVQQQLERGPLLWRAGKLDQEEEVYLLEVSLTDSSWWKGQWPFQSSREKQRSWTLSAISDAKMRPQEHAFACPLVAWSLTWNQQFSWKVF